MRPIVAIAPPERPLWGTTLPMARRKPSSLLKACIMVLSCVASGVCVVVACVVRFGGGPQSPNPCALAVAALVLFGIGVALHRSNGG